MSHSIALQKSTLFAKRILRLYQCLTKERGEFILSKQILRSGTSIGANLHECINAQSRADFVSKMQIALKEANETDYWLELFLESEIIDQLMYKSLHDDLNEIIALLISSIKTTKTKDK